MVYKDQNSPIYSAFSTLCIDTIEKKIYRVSFGPYLRHDKSNSLSDRTMVVSTQQKAQTARKTAFLCDGNSIPEPTRHLTI